MDIAKHAILARYRLSAADFLSQGMEAEVYAYGTDNVLKLYPRSASLENLRLLQTFYNSLDRSVLSYALPQIRQIHDQGTYIVVIETRLSGRPLAEVIASTPNQLETLLPLYVAAVLELEQIAMPDSVTQYKLFDQGGLSTSSTGDWHQFLRGWLDAKLQVLSPHFARDVEDFAKKLRHMHRLLAQPYTGLYRLIHGDIFPGNILVDVGGKALALLDFGLFTMYGDPLWDAATAWAFFDMYDKLGANVRARLLPVFLEQLGEKVRDKLYRYLLLYSLLSANTYATDCSDGHYRWCVANLNAGEYWLGAG